jgi:hypothetical protein
MTGSRTWFFVSSGEGSLSRDLPLSDGSASPHKLRYCVHEEAVGKERIIWLRLLGKKYPRDRELPPKGLGI